MCLPAGASSHHAVPEPLSRSAVPAHRPEARPDQPATPPSGNVRRTSAANRNANRVFPTPPTPVSVSNRASPKSRRASDSSRRRPTKLVLSMGRLPS
jgi:hypothetical protein